MSGPAAVDAKSTVSARGVAIGAGVLMLAVYVVTLAPSVTFWDAGEFIAAARTLGIPHPPGTPLFIIALNAWARLFPFLSFAAATNLLSAVCTAGAVCLSGFLVARRSPSAWVAWSAVAAGATTSVWQNATETEVYAASLLLAIATVAAADVAGRRRDRRWLAISGYLIVLSVPLHLSALVASPAAIYLAARGEDDRVDWSGAVLLAACAIIAFATSRMSAMWGGVGVLTLFVGAELERRAGESVATAVRVLAATVVGLSALAFLIVRARHDPAINQGNSATWSDVAAVVTRKQYAVAGLWPRQAPIWVQLANWFEYADWQFALSLGPTVIPTIARVAATVVFAVLAVIGASWQRRFDRRRWRAFLILFACGSLGVLAYLNLKAGSSFGWTFIPDESRHEARDRDYFFVLGFWVWGLWAGLGVLRVASWLRLPRFIGMALVCMPIVLNWTAVDRREEPEAGLPRQVASALLDPLPNRAVLFVDGDNDTYPLWYAQQVERRRPDVTVVTIPLLGAAWYMSELERRHGLRALPVPADRVDETSALAAGIASAAHRQGRPVAVSFSVGSDVMSLITREWTVIGAVAMADFSRAGPPILQSDDSLVIRVDSVRTRQAAVAVEGWRNGRVAKPSTDPTSEYFLTQLSCAPFRVGIRPRGVPIASLDSTCNLR